VTEARKLVHGTCVALGRRGALLRGESGAGKSDLALRFLALTGDGELRPILVADDQVLVEANGKGQLFASPPQTIAGKIEIRGLGIVVVPYLPEAELMLVCDLVNEEDVPRMPPEPWDRTEIAGRLLPALKLAPFELSAPLKLKMALLLAAPDNPN
jgi:serine kinase of HPr protein (carbohydrate metabolism regulator)